MTMSRQIDSVDREALAERVTQSRALTEALAAPLLPEDQTVQSMPDVSPTKWHRAHTTWFYEAFVLEPHMAGYRPVHPSYGYLFNSYYEQVGDRHPRHLRGLASRPSTIEVGEYRTAVDRALQELLCIVDDHELELLAPLIELGIQHEQQHQELLLMDIKHVFWSNPLRPAYRLGTTATGEHETAPLKWVEISSGADARTHMGHDALGFSFDNELPRHDVLVPPFALAQRLTTEGEWLSFMDDGGYERPELWLSDGWAHVRAECWSAPLYWEHDGNDWTVFTLGGSRPVHRSTPVTHLSYYECDAFARWAGVRLPTEQEWELAARAAAADDEANDLSSGALHPRPARKVDLGVAQLSGDGWEWTSSAYGPYPGFHPASGAIGEYNGKFMSGQMVLRGGAPITPPGHARTTYRNFYPPAARWPFTTLRLARSAQTPDDSPTEETSWVRSDDTAIRPRRSTSTPSVVVPVIEEYLTGEDQEQSLAADVARAFAAPQLRLSPKWLYDDRGSELFDQITRLDAYYPTRREREVLEREAAAIARISAADTVVELGSGTSDKTRLVLDAMARTSQLVRYAPIDVSAGVLGWSAHALARRYPGLEVHAVVGDFDRHLGHVPTDGTRLFAFLGGTIGNYERPERAEMLQRLSSVMAEGDALLLGTDLVKDVDRLLLAYDDPAGITAQFNLTLLRILQRRLGAQLDQNGWRHRAVWNADEESIEMHLVAVGPQRIAIPALEVDRSFGDGEHLHTETSAKFRRAGVAAELDAAGLATTEWWTDERGDFGVSLARKLDG